MYSGKSNPVLQIADTNVHTELWTPFKKLLVKCNYIAECLNTLNEYISFTTD